MRGRFAEATQAGMPISGTCKVSSKKGRVCEKTKVPEPVKQADAGNQQMQAKGDLQTNEHGARHQSAHAFDQTRHTQEQQSQVEQQTACRHGGCAH